MILVRGKDWVQVGVPNTTHLCKLADLVAAERHKPANADAYYNTVVLQTGDLHALKEPTHPGRVTSETNSICTRGACQRCQ